MATALQFYKDAHDKQMPVSKELKCLSTWLAEISTRADENQNAIEACMNIVINTMKKSLGCSSKDNKNRMPKRVVYSSNCSLMSELMLLFTI